MPLTNSKDGLHCHVVRPFIDVVTSDLPLDLRKTLLLHYTNMQVSTSLFLEIHEKTDDDYESTAPLSFLAVLSMLYVLLHEKRYIIPP